MPVVFRYKGFRFYFYSNEGDPQEPVHVHVYKDDDDAKFWLYPVASVAYNRGFDARTLAELLSVVDERREEIKRAWDGHFGQG